MRPQRPLALLFAALAFLSLPTTACGDDDDDGKEACDEVARKCPGAPVACDANRINDSDKRDAIDDCIEDAADCNAAQACLQGI